MSFDLAVWHAETAPTAKESFDLYLKLCSQEFVFTEERPEVAAFYAELCQRYPEIDSLPEDQLDRCPWSCAHDRSGSHMIMCMSYGDELERAAEFITELAKTHGLVCFDPQGSNVYLPPNLKPKPSRFRFW